MLCILSYIYFADEVYILLLISLCHYMICKISLITNFNLKTWISQATLLHTGKQITCICFKLAQIYRHKCSCRPPLSQFLWCMHTHRQKHTHARAVIYAHRMCVLQDYIRNVVIGGLITGCLCSKSNNTMWHTNTYRQVHTTNIHVQTNTYSTHTHT